MKPPITEFKDAVELLAWLDDPYDPRQFLDVVSLHALEEARSYLNMVHLCQLEKHHPERVVIRSGERQASYDQLVELKAARDLIVRLERVHYENHRRQFGMDDFITDDGSEHPGPTSTAEEDFVAVPEEELQV
jgi:hypothetical protein